MELNEKQFIAGFNSGYLLAKHEPEIINSILKKIGPVNSFISSMVKGRMEYELECANKQFGDLVQFGFQKRI